MELTGKQLDALQFRRQRLESKVQELEALVSGREVRLFPEDGGHSEARTWALVDQLEQARDLCRRYQQWNGGAGEALPPAPSRAQDQQEASFYRSFFYCALRVLEDCPDWLMSAAGTCADLLHLAEQVHYTDWVDLYYDEMYRLPVIDGFFGVMDKVYGLLTGQSICAAAPDEEWEQVHRRYAPEIQEMELALQEAQEAVITPELADELADYYTEETLRQAQEEAVWQAQQEEKQNAWGASFQEKETFCQQYLQCRSLYFQTAAWKELPNTVRQVVDLHLFLQDGVGLMDDSRFFSAFALLERAITQVRQLLEG